MICSFAIGFPLKVLSYGIVQNAKTMNEIVLKC